MQDGIYAHPDWYPSLRASSPFEGFQAQVHADDATLCPEPCAPRVEACHTATPSDTGCWDAVSWAMHDGIFSNPEWYPRLAPFASGLEEFQAAIHASTPHLCPRPCELHYTVSGDTPYRGHQQKDVVKGISYGPSPLKHNELLTDDDFMSDIAAVQWADWGRGDLQIMKALGANTVRTYGNDPNISKRLFLDEAMKQGMGVVVGISDYPYIQGATPCMRTGFDCFDNVYVAYKANLLRGFTINNFTAYHPALRSIILMNEPDLAVHPRRLVCRAMISAFDAVLQAEKDVGVTGNPVSITVTFSYAVFNGPPALGQMKDFHECILDPSGPPTRYTPRNDVLRAYKARFVNSFNTANPALSVKNEFLDKYAEAGFWTEELKIPVFIGEYHSVFVDLEEDLPSMMKAAVEDRSKHPFFLGYSFFEYSVRYDKGGSEEKFGIYGFGQCAISHMNFSGKVYNIWDLVPQLDKDSNLMDRALSAAFGGSTASLSLGPKSCIHALPE